MVADTPAGRSPGGDEMAGALLAVVGDLAAEAHPGTRAPTVSLDSRLDRELGLDSLALAELLVRLEERFAVELPDEVLAVAQTPRDLLDALSSGAATPTRSRSEVRERPARPAEPPARLELPERAGTLVEVLDHHAALQPDREHIRVLDDRGDEVLTYRELRHQAAEVAAGLRSLDVEPGASVAIMLPTGPEYFVTFAGVLLAGCVPAPVYPPARPAQLEEHLRRHVRILDNAQAQVLVTVGRARGLARLVAPQVPSLRHVVTPEDLRAPDHAPRPGGRGVDASTTALLQYTSGSTGDPKGVVLSHANLLASIRAMGSVGEVVPTDVFVSWLPLYHDMGLIGAWLTSLYHGIPLVVMSPLRFLARPARWLEALHEHRGTISGGPNFGFELCVRRVDDAEVAGLDLGEWRVAFNGAEPINPATIERFVDRFAPIGLDPGAIAPVYGLAECSLALTIPRLGRGAVIDRVAREPLARSGRALAAAADDPNPARFVACGPPLPGHEARIVGRRDGAVLAERHEGRIQFRGPSTTSGYHRNPEATRRLFDDDWLESGDLGYLAGGELYVTGRVKDLIIRAGQNLHPAELEDAVGEIDGIRKGCVAVFAAADADGGTERLVVLAESRADEEERERLHAAVNDVGVEVTGTPPDEVCLVEPGTVPKTSSGKVRRAVARERYETGRLEASGSAVWRQVARLGAGSLLPGLRRAVRAVTGSAYGVYATGLFALATLVVWPLVAVLPGVQRRWRVVRTAGWLLVRAAGVRPRVEGLERLPDHGAYVVAANHASLLDSLFVALVLPRPAVFAAVGGLADNPWVRVFLRRLEVQLVDRGDRVRGVAASEALTEVARSGRPVVFFPEGRRSTAPGLEPFKMGAFTVAANAGVPVVPVTLRGTRGLLPVGTRLPRRSTVAIDVAEPVTTDEPGWAGAVELHRATREAILARCDEPDVA